MYEMETFETRIKVWIRYKPYRHYINWEYRIAAIAEDCKSSLIEFSGSSPLTPTNELPSSVVNWTFLVIEGVYKLRGHEDDYGKRIMLLITYR